MTWRKGSLRIRSGGRKDVAKIGEIAVDISGSGLLVRICACGGMIDGHRPTMVQDGPSVYRIQGTKLRKVNCVIVISGAGDGNRIASHNTKSHQTKMLPTLHKSIGAIWCQIWVLLLRIT